MSISVYVHVPFCASKCKYCDFFSAPGSDETREAYVNAIVRSIGASEVVAEPVRSIYFGGGTPSVLTEGQLGRILDALDEKFDLSEAEMTLEVNPDSVANARSDRGLWFNRFSMGVQSFDDRELRVLGRRHTAEEAEEAYRFLRSFAKNVSIDLMIGLPTRKHEDAVDRALKKVSELDPEHVSVYILQYEKNTPMYQLKELAMEDEEVTELYLKVSRTLREMGYEHYEISNFAKKGFRSRHNCAYWEQKRYIAFGPGAHGFDGQSRYYYTDDLKDFLEANGEVTPVAVETMGAEELFSERIMLGLRTSDGISESCYKHLVSDPEKEALCRELIKSGLGKETPEGGFVLTAEGWVVSNTILEKLIF